LITTDERALLGNILRRGMELARMTPCSRRFQFLYIHTLTPILRSVTAGVMVG
jgi:hypothetical protein